MPARSPSSSDLEQDPSSKKLTAKQDSQRQRILSAASDVFLESGFEKTSTIEIARRARVSKRELYINFADKRALLAAVILDLQSQMQARMHVRWASHEDLATILEDVARGIREFLLSEQFGKLLRIVIAESFHDPTLAEEFYSVGPNRGREETALFLKSQMKIGRLQKGNSLKAADDFLSLVVGPHLVMTVMLGRDAVLSSHKTDLKHAVQMFLTCYAPEDADRASRIVRGASGRHLSIRRPSNL